jgi:hypothetical protein
MYQHFFLVPIVLQALYASSYFSCLPHGADRRSKYKIKDALAGDRVSRKKKKGYPPKIASIERFQVNNRQIIF